MMNFQQLIGEPRILRGSAPTEQDVRFLKAIWKVKRIVSLDQPSAMKIINVCKELGIHHIIYPMVTSSIVPLEVERLKNSIVSLLDTEQPVFIHCQSGENRTGLAIALYRVKKGWSCQQALEEARKFHFGVRLSEDLRQAYETAVCGKERAKKAQDDATSQVRQQLFESHQLGPDLYHQFYNGDATISKDQLSPPTPTEDLPAAEMTRRPQDPIANHYDVARADDSSARKKRRRKRQRLIALLLKDRNEAFPEVGMYRDCSPLFRTLGPVDSGGLSPGNISYNY